MKALIVLLAVAFAPAAFANTYVKCGKTADFDSWEVTGYELELSSEGEDDYSGPVGLNWNMKLKSEDSEWLGVNKNITAKNYKRGPDTIVEIMIVDGMSPTGPVGTKYVLTGLYDEEPKLEKFTMGGFVGEVRLATFQCISGNI